MFLLSGKATAKQYPETYESLPEVMDAALLNVGSWGSYAAATLTGCQGTSSGLVSHGSDREATCRLVLHSLT